MATTQTRTLIYKIEWDTGDAAKQADAWAKRLEEMARDAKKAFSQMGVSAKTSMSIIGQALKIPLSPLSAFLKGIKTLGSLLLSPFKTATKIITSFSKSVKQGFQEALKTTTTFITTSAKNWLAYEDLLIVVSRTTGQAWEETKRLGEALIDMSLSLGEFASGGAFEQLGLQAGIAVENLAKVAGIAGQLGITGAQNLLEFVNVVGKMAVATNFSAQKAAEFLAIMRQLFNLDASGLSRLASVVNELGNTTVATQSEIGELLRRMAGTAEFFGLTAEKVAALGATLRQAGVTVRVGGTAISQLLQKMLTDGANFAEALGLNWKTMKEQIESNSPEQALLSILHRIQEIKNIGGKIDVAERLKEMKITGIGLQDTLLKLSANTGALVKNLRNASKEWRENDSLTNEFNKTLETTRHQFSQFSGMIDAVIKVVGKDLSEAFGNFTEKYLTPMVEKFLEWVRSPDAKTFLQETIPKALDWIGEKLTQLADRLTVFFNQLISGQVWQGLKDIVSDTFAGIRTFVSNTWENIFGDIRFTINQIKDNVRSGWEEIKTTVVSAGQQILDTLVNALRRMGETIGDIFGPKMQQQFESTMTFLKSLPGVISSVANALKNVAKTLAEIGDMIKKAKQSLDNFRSNPVGSTMDMLTGKVKSVARAGGEVVTSFEQVNDAQNIILKEGVTNSVWPELDSWINRTTASTLNFSKSLDTVIDKTRQASIEAQAALQSLPSQMSQPGVMPPAGIVRASSPPQPRATPSSSSPAMQPTATRTPVMPTVIFQGYNVLDETSKTRFVEEFTKAQKANYQNTVRV